MLNDCELSELNNNEQMRNFEIDRETFIEFYHHRNNRSSLISFLINRFYVV